MTRRQVAQGWLTFRIVYTAGLTKLSVCPLPLEAALMTGSALRLCQINVRADRARRRRRRPLQCDALKVIS